MKLKKASAWVYNKSTRNIVISELGLVIRKGETVDLFQRNPQLRYEAYLASKEDGVLAQKRKYLIPVHGPPAPIERRTLNVAKEPLIKRARSARGMSEEEKDWVALLEDEFPVGAQPLTDRERWDLERTKMIEDLGENQGDEGEVFSDTLFDDVSSDEF